MLNLISAISRIDEQGNILKSIKYFFLYRNCSVLSVAKRYGIPYTTLVNRRKGQSSRKGPQPIFTESEERILVRHVLYMAEIQLPVDKGYIIRTAQYLLKAEAEEGLQRVTKIHTAKLSSYHLGKTWWRVRIYC